MSFLSSVMRLLDAVINRPHPAHLPRSNAEVIQLLKGLKSKEEIVRSHANFMEPIKEQEELRRICLFTEECLILVTSIAEYLIEFASGDSPIESARVCEALSIIYQGFGQLEPLADDFEARPQPFQTCCFAYLAGCLKYSILFQRLLYPEDQCEYLDLLAEPFKSINGFSLKIDSIQNYPKPNSQHITLYNCIPPDDKIPIFCWLQEQPGKPVRQQYYRNKNPYGPRLLRNMNHPSNQAYIRKKGYIL
ncbi:052bbdd1-3ca3-41c4-b66a-87b461d487cd [Sclerotinia trifoliorum]|uniref:052bbdd1-3ca3-41c4-b66a-87b461d487cd n=1 Tax=Sclerotinia trifoliorum TaxID=28548 RepID=A0A8H2VXF1_9HELO|nr:052bbdd1-3ca3-41c4-b66a-87b461d487cd [Sclerotinia trifoliorum]